MIMKGEQFGKMEVAENTQETIPQPMSGLETANLVGQLFDKLPKEVRKNLVDSNVVLTMAGLKPQTEFFIDVPNDQSLGNVKRGIEMLNEFLKELNPNLRFKLVDKPFISPTDKQRTQMISVENLLGFDRASKKSKLPFMAPFDLRSGWNGLQEWAKGVNGKIEKIKANTKEESDRKNLDTLVTGFVKGYPDQAIYDYADWFKGGKKRKRQRATDISYVGMYDEAEPVYSFYPEHSDDESIRENIEAAGEILKEFYESDWHRKVEPELTFHRNKFSRNS